MSLSERSRLDNVLRHNTYASHKKYPGLNYSALASIVVERGLLPSGRNVNLKVRSSSRLLRSELVELIRGNLRSGVTTVHTKKPSIKIIDLRRASTTVDDLVKSWRNEATCFKWACRITDQGVTSDHVMELIENKIGTHIALGTGVCNESERVCESEYEMCQGITSFCIFSIYPGQNDAYIWMLCAANRANISGKILYRAVEEYIIAQVQLGAVLRLCSVPQAYQFWSKMGFQDIWDSHLLATTCVDTKEGPFVDGISMRKRLSLTEDSALISSPGMTVALDPNWKELKVKLTGVSGNTIIKVDEDAIGVVLSSGFYFWMYPEFLSDDNGKMKWNTLQMYEIRFSILMRRGYIKPKQEPQLSKCKLRFLYLQSSNEAQGAIKHDAIDIKQSLRRYTKPISFVQDSLNAVVIFRTRKRTNRGSRRNFANDLHVEQEK